MKNIPLTLDEIKRLHETGHLKEAKLHYLRFLEAHSQKNNQQVVTALHMLGVLYAEEGDFSQAQEYLEQAIELNSEEPILQLHLANILKAQGLFNKAVAVLLNLTAAQPTFAAAFNNLGTVYYAQAKLQEAIHAYQTAIDSQPNYVDAYYNLGLALSKAKRFNEAAQAYQAVTELSPQHSGAYFQLACLLMQQNKYQEASDCFAKIERDHPFHFETQANLASCYLKLGLLDKAKKHYLKALEIMPHDDQVLFNLGVISMQQDRVDEAIEFYLRVVKEKPRNFDAHNNLAFIYLITKNNEMALSHYQEALRIQPNNEAIRHTVDILLQKKNVITSPPDYIRSLFDSYADHFDAHLLHALHYQVPTLFYQTLKVFSREDHSWDIVDLGCGTGLCGEVFRPLAKTLIGVDLSAKMLAVAAQKKVYDELIEADIVAFLSNKNRAYDVIVAGDTFVYAGDLRDVFSAVTQALKPGGFVIFNTEISMKEDYLMTTSGRFAHSKTYLDKLISQHHLSLLRHEIVTLRTQNHEAVQGYLYLLQK